MCDGGEGAEAAAITQLEECGYLTFMRHKANRSVRINNTIVNELSEVKMMLDEKRREISTREAELAKREKNF